MDRMPNVKTFTSGHPESYPILTRYFHVTDRDEWEVVPRHANPSRCNDGLHLLLLPEMTRPGSRVTELRREDERRRHEGASSLRLGPQSADSFSNRTLWRVHVVGCSARPSVLEKLAAIREFEPSVLSIQSPILDVEKHGRGVRVQAGGTDFVQQMRLEPARADIANGVTSRGAERRAEGVLGDNLIILRTTS